MFAQLCFIVLIVATQLALASNTCYFPDGNASTDVPCDGNALFTQCCGSSDKCLSNGLCVIEATNTTGIEYARGTCTDKTWASSLCPQECQLNQDTPNNASAYDFRTNGVEVWQCGTTGYGKEAQYCCESQAERQRCCSTETAVFTLQGAVAGASTSASTTSTPSSVSSAKSSSFAPTATDPTISEAASTSAASATSTPTSTSNGPDDSKIIGIGAGVGGAVVLVLLIAIILLLVQRFKRVRKSTESQGPNVSELHGEGGVRPVEVWTQPQELPSQAPVWEMSADPKTPRLTSV